MTTLDDMVDELAAHSHLLRPEVERTAAEVLAYFNDPAHSGAAETLLDSFLQRYLEERERDYALAHYEDDARW